MTKMKDKKADKKKPLSSTTSSMTTKKEHRVVVEPPVAKAETVAPEQFLDVAPIEVLQEASASVTTTVARRTISNDERRRLITLAAYYRAQRVGFGKTNPVEDWLWAEREVDAMMATENVT